MFPFWTGCREALSQTLCPTVVQAPGAASPPPSRRTPLLHRCAQASATGLLKVRDLIFLYYGSSYGINNKEEKKSMRTGWHSSSGVPLHRDKPLADAALRIHLGKAPHSFPSSLSSHRLNSLDWNSGMPLGKLQALTLVTSSALPTSGRQEASKHTPRSCRPSWVPLSR